MTGLPATVDAFCRLHALLPPQDNPVAVGLSGGADSVALLRVLVSLGVKVEAYHCNFHLRGAESDRDEQFCRDLCRQMGIPLAIRHFDVAARMAGTGESVEMACRELRYGWWRSSGVGTLAVAHHADDNAETLLLNLMRGTGLRGLKGMLPRNGHIIRPLLCVGREEILEYLESIGQDYVTDSTNAACEYRRNRIRNRLLPVFEELFPGSVEGIKRTVGSLWGNFAIYEDAVGRLRGKYTAADSGDILIDRIKAEEADPASVLYEILAPEGFNIDQCRDMLNPAETLSGRRFGNRIMEHGVLSIIPQETAAHSLTLDAPPFSLTEIDREEFKAIIGSGNAGRDVMFMDASVLDGNPEFMLRPWREGDRLAPFGMKGTRLVSDIYSDAKIGVARRNRYPLLVLGDKILWVCGLRASRHYAVTPRTERILMIRYSL